MAKLHVSPMFHANSFNTNLSVVEMDIYNYIINRNKEEYDNILMEDERWEIFYHMSVMRESLFNWYEFDDSSTLLEIGGNFGALTGLFCDKCAHVVTIEESLMKASAICKRYADRDNLEICVSDIHHYVTKQKFDYIIAVGTLETIFNGINDINKYSEFLNMLADFLKPEGKILFSVENRYGIRYFCGAREPHTGIPFDGISKYPKGTSGYSFSKKELVDIIEKSNIINYKFYYPLPDYKLPQLIYSEKYLKGSNIRERLIPYYIDKISLIANEMDIYVDLMENQVLDFFSNSFLVECGKKNNFCSIIYAAVSTDRSRGQDFATTIHENGIVKKRLLSERKSESLVKMCENIKYLDLHGVKVIPHELSNNVLIMPYIEEKTCSNYLMEIIKYSPEKFIFIFDYLYECILRSSEHLDNEQNALLVEENKNDDYGVILKRAYIDMVPGNCFYKDDNLYFFDQEFVKEKFPAKYVLFRAIKYTYMYIKNANKIIPIEELKKRYGLESIWGNFEKEEEKFIESNRNKQLYNHYYKWTGVNKKIIYANINMLLSDTFKKPNETKTKEPSAFILPKKLKDIQEIEYSLLKELIRVCQKFNLIYYPFYGTLLGAVRHKKFIPWDDDIDIAMPRKDYNELCSKAKHEFKEPYVLIMPEDEKECFYGGYAKLRNYNTTGIEIQNWNHNCNHGIWIDIFPLDDFDEDDRKRTLQLKKVRIYQRLLYSKAYGKQYKAYLDLTYYKWKIYYILSHMFSHKFLCRQLDKALQQGNEKNSSFYGILARYSKPNDYIFLDKNNFEVIDFTNFGDLILPLPRGYKEILETIIGTDYLTLPPKKSQKPHHKAFYITDTPYKIYLERFRIFLNSKDNLKIVLFGAGTVAKNYLKKYGKKYKPSFLIDHDSKKWGTLQDGIMIRAPKDILNIDKNNLKVIICSEHYQEIENQLRSMKIEEYYIFVQNPEKMIESFKEDD